MRGAFINVSGSGSSGGSTITQQLVRAIYPDQISALDISYTRKAREALAAVALAQQYSKTDIFTMYVNQIYYGNRAYGVEAAANTYLRQARRRAHACGIGLPGRAATIALLLRPTISTRPRSAKLRARPDGQISLHHARRSRSRLERTDRRHQRPQPARSLAAPHFTEYVRQYIIENYGEEALYGGLEITTSIDLELQARAEQIVANGVSRMTEFGRNNGAMVVMVPWSGEVLAMVGSADFSNALINGEVNYATSLIQPGSSMKPIVYAAGIRARLNPGSVLMDVPTAMGSTRRTSPMSRRTTPGSFYGAISVREALANSFNIPAVKATEYVGVQGVMDTARDMGLVDSLEQDAGFYGLSIGLGAAEVQLLEHTNAYATLANNGTNVRRIRSSRSRTARTTCSIRWTMNKSRRIPPRRFRPETPIR